MLRLNCFFQAKDGRLDDALAAAKELTAASLKQDGCIGIHGGIEFPVKTGTGFDWHGLVDKYQNEDQFFIIIY